MSLIKATARVILTLEVEASGAWGAECSVEQLQKQAARETVLAIRNMIGASTFMANRCRVVGEQQVTIVVVNGADK